MRRLALILLAALALSACDQGSAPKPSGPSADTALDMMFHNKYSAAAGQLQALIKSHPSDPKPLAAYALLLNYEIKLPSALTQARQAQRLAPSDPYVLTVLTRVEDWNFQISAAVTDGLAAVSKSPDSALARAFYGEALADTGKYTEAQAQLNKGADLAKHGTAYERAEIERNWSNYYRDRRDYPQALTHLKLAAVDQPSWIERLLELANFSLGRQDLAAATTYLQRAGSLLPDDAGLLEGLGEVALAAQVYDVAKKAYSAALALQPRSNLDLKVLGNIVVALDHDFSTAAKDERAAIADQPSDQEAGAYLVAVLRYLVNDPTQALKVAQTAIAPSTGAGSIDLDKEALDRQAAALATVNRYRKLAGLGPIGSSNIVHQAALAHAFYTFFNGNSPTIAGERIHNETTGGLGYTGDNMLARAQHFGYPTASMAEVITHQTDPQRAVTDWIDSVYHRIPILRADLSELGYGDAYLGPLTAQVMDMSFKESLTGRIILYPAADQTGVPVAFRGNEIPDPAPNAAYPIGYPITATFDRTANVSISSFHFVDPSGTDLPGVSLKPGTDTENSFAFLANTPLQPSTVYVMQLNGTINGVAFNRTWRFTTEQAPAPSPQVQQASLVIAN